ncbi:MAG: helix-hairpin-helix domain-containing protein [Byssovorax sp.]
MEARAAKKKVGAAATAGSNGVIGRVRAAIAESAWGAMVGKGVLAVVGFVVLALVGSWRIGGSGGRIGIAEASAATVSASASAAVGIKAAPEAGASASASASTSTSTSTSTGGGGEIDAGVGEAGPAVTAEGKVAINRANEQDLRRLPGIGATRAKAILALRERLGRFRRPEDLLRVKGIGRRMLGRIRPLVIIEP